MLYDSFWDFYRQLKHFDRDYCPPGVHCDSDCKQRHELHQRVHILVGELEGRIGIRQGWQLEVDAVTEHYKRFVGTQRSGPHGLCSHSYTEHMLEQYNNAKRELIRVSTGRDMASLAIMQHAEKLVNLQEEYGRLAVSFANAVERAKFPERFFGKSILIRETADEISVISAALRDW